MKKGFTLIELLGTIVILGMIALVATPPIVNLIKKSDKKIEINNIRMIYNAGMEYMSEFENDYELVSSKNICLPIQKIVDNGNLKESFVKQQKINLNQAIKFMVGKKMKLSYELKLYDGNCKNVVNIDTATTPLPTKTYTVGEVVYFDPTGSVTDCNASKIWTPTNTGTTCYKWNVIKDNGNNVEMLLDHNSTAKIAWALKEDYIAAGGTSSDYGAYGNNNKGPITTIKQLKADTTNWTKVETLTSSDNVTRDANGGTKYTINYAGMKARLISGQEVANIGKDTVWTPDNETRTVYSASPWLYQNTYNNGDNSNYGYWTDTAYPSYAHYSWSVNYAGRLATGYVYTASNNGVRPVVRVLKINL